MCVCCVMCVCVCVCVVCGVGVCVCVCVGGGKINYKLMFTMYTPTGNTQYSTDIVLAPITVLLECFASIEHNYFASVYQHKTTCNLFQNANLVRSQRVKFSDDLHPQNILVIQY